MKSKALSSIIAVCLCASLGASVKADTWKPSPEIKTAAAGMKNAVTNVEYMRARVIYTNHLPPQISDAIDMDRKNESRLPQSESSGSTITKVDTLWQIAGTDVYIKTVSFRDGDAKSNTVTTWKKNGIRYQSSLLWSGKTAEGKRHLFIDGSIAPILKIKSPPDLFLDGIANLPLRLAFNNALADSFLQKKTNAVFNGYNNIDGNKCMKIETHTSKDALSTWWIDVNHGFVIYRSEYILNRDGISDKIVTQASHLVKYGNTWLPQKIETKFDWNNMVKLMRKKDLAALPASLKEESVVLPPQVQTYTIQDVSIGDKAIPPVVWPLGTNLYVNNSGYALTVTAITQSELMKLNRERKTHDSPALHEYPIGAQKPGLIGVGLKDSEVKHLKKWRASDKL